MATFGVWLGETAQLADDGPVGYLAGLWKAAAGHRPKIYTAPKIIDWLTGQAATAADRQAVAAAGQVATERYRDREKPDGGRAVTEDEQARFAAMNAPPEQAGPAQPEGIQLKLHGEPAAGHSYALPSDAPAGMPIWLGELRERMDHQARMLAMIMHTLARIAQRFGIEPEHLDEAMAGAARQQAAACDPYQGEPPGAAHARHVAELRAMGPQTDPATGQDRRLQGATPEELGYPRYPVEVEQAHAAAVMPQRNAPPQVPMSQQLYGTQAPQQAPDGALERDQFDRWWGIVSGDGGSG